MNILEFDPSFTDEKAEEFYLKLRLDTGVICKNCGCKKHYWAPSIKMFQCSDCEFRTSLKSGTCLQHSKLSIRTWLLAIWYISQFKKSVPALRIQQLIGVKSYKTAHLLLMKIRNSMSISQIERIGGKLDSFVRLSEELSVKQDNDGGHSVLVSNTRDETNKYTVHFVSFNNLGKYRPDVKSHKSKARSHMWDLQEASGCPELEPVAVKRWIKKHLRNLDRNLFGIYHGVDSIYCQLYFDEFSFRTNCSMAGESYFNSILRCLISGNWYAI